MFCVTFYVMCCFDCMAGTPLYMAPELVQEKPYTNAVDLWSLGVILYELFYGVPPFYTNNIYTLIHLIIKEKVKFPAGISAEFRDFLHGLLHKNPSKRLNWPEVSSHPFIAGPGAPDLGGRLLYWKSCRRRMENHFQLSGDIDSVSFVDSPCTDADKEGKEGDASTSSAKASFGEFCNGFQGKMNANASQAIINLKSFLDDESMESEVTLERKNTLFQPIFEYLTGKDAGSVASLIPVLHRLMTHRNFESAPYMTEFLQFDKNSRARSHFVSRSMEILMKGISTRKPMNFGLNTLNCHILSRIFADDVASSLTRSNGIPYVLHELVSYQRRAMSDELRDNVDGFMHLILAYLSHRGRFDEPPLPAMFVDFLKNQKLVKILTPDGAVSAFRIISRGKLDQKPFKDHADKILLRLLPFLEPSYVSHISDKSFRNDFICGLLDPFYQLFHFPRTQKIMEEKDVISKLNQLILHDYIELPFWHMAFGIISRLVLFAPPFAHQFVKGGGLSSKIIKTSLCEKNLIMDGLLIVSQLARIGPQFYEELHAADLYHEIEGLLAHEEPSVKGKACNLVGNMCRHSAFFYPHFKQSGVLKNLMACLRDEDKTTQKFACFAVGNAAFHGDALYDTLQPCMGDVVHLLGSDDEKTVANAAGALGNFVRNGSLLFEDLLRLNSVEKLVGIAKQASSSSSSPSKIALFSLGNFCQFGPARERLRKISFEETLQSIVRVSPTDVTVTKYVARIRKRLGLK
eukprot:TRINITY_DN649_c0_g1_i7.p1 TRINITY_DN649_c0_g1~~TRINITY_DN649_c0_g1_i7.p1  ORF type:complete len:745 (+),score=150.32 TRINITY_DN649_c0_g1_i7:75-2309(+)